MVAVTITKKDRWLYALMMLTIMGIIVFILSTVLSYFKTGAQKTNIYEQGVILLEDHNPEILWLPDDLNIQGEVNEYLRKEITQSYSDAWGILNLSMARSRDLGLKENFSDRQSEILKADIIQSNSVFRTDLSHKLKLHFLSLDKQVISFSDVEMISQIRLNNGEHSAAMVDTSSYQVIMLLNDGKWRVDKIIRGL